MFQWSLTSRGQLIIYSFFFTWKPCHESGWCFGWLLFVAVKVETAPALNRQRGKNDQVIWRIAWVGTCGVFVVLGEMMFYTMYEWWCCIWMCASKSLPQHKQKMRVILQYNIITCVRIIMIHTTFKNKCLLYQIDSTWNFEAVHRESWILLSSLVDTSGFFRNKGVIYIYIFIYWS